MILLYGANGYTGELIARRAASLGVHLVLAGRNRAAVEALAGALSFAHRSFALDDPAAIARNLAGVNVVLNCAGPFSRTAAPLAAACIDARVHYLDITGELEVFERMAAQDDAARAAGVTLLPGAGFDVVPSDCLATHVASKVPSATELRIAFQTSSRASRGTATTALEYAGAGCLARRDGKLERVPAGSRQWSVDFGRGARPAIAIPWGDVATAYRSTGIPNIETFIAVPAMLRLLVRADAVLRWPPADFILTFPSVAREDLA